MELIKKWPKSINLADKSKVMELSKTKLNMFSSLGSAKMRKKYGLFTVEGEKSVADTIDIFTPEAVICERGHVPAYIPAGTPLYETDHDEMGKLSNLTTPPSVMAVYRIPKSTDADLEVESGLYVVLDGIQDPGNLGTIVRTCHWFGIYTIFASKDTVDIFNPKSVQATMGSIAKVNVHYCDICLLLDSNPGLPVYGTLLEGENIFKATLSRNGFIVMGNEGKGISEEVRKRISVPLNITPACADHSESLNVSVAAAITVALFRK